MNDNLFSHNLIINYYLFPYLYNFMIDYHSYYFWSRLHTTIIWIFKLTIQINDMH